jgi:hypothetical protein
MLTRVTKLPLFLDGNFEKIQNCAVDLVNRWNGFDDLQRQSETLQGIQWKDYSCSLDAILMIFLRLVEILHKTEDWTKKGESKILHHLLENAAVLLKTPWHSRTPEDMDQFRDKVREGLWKEACIKIVKTSILKRIDNHIIPRRWITFHVESKIQCSNCGNEYTVCKNATGLSFSLRDDSLAALTNVQAILQSIVCYLCCEN